LGHNTNSRLKLLLKNKYFLYLLLTVVPAAAVSLILIQQQLKGEASQNLKQAQEYASFHAMNIEQFLGETSGRLDMLGTSIKLQSNDQSDIEKILEETAKRDPRFSGFYWANTNGELIISTNPMENAINVKDQVYFQKAINSQKTTISDVHMGRITGRNIISIATPVVSRGVVKGILIASLRIDEIAENIKKLLKNEMVTVKDHSGKTIIKAGSLPLDNTVNFSVKAGQIPWTITAYTLSNTKHVFQEYLLKNFIILLTISNILFLWVKYWILRRRIKMETEQTEVQKLELIGRLAASTAHEIRNPLTGIKGLVKLLSEDYKDEKAQAYFEVIQTEIDRINTIVSELLVLGKPTAYRLNIYNANDIMAEIEPIIRSEANFMNVEFKIDYSKESLPVSCVKDQLKQVILNLSKNSLQAMPEGGMLTIDIKREESSCMITVIDNGVGMSKEQIAQAFNPFYTLKKDGSGLGLTVCKRIIEGYGGEIFITSSPDKGTQVKMNLPLT